ncbi:ANTAR domain protein with unknown sensor [Kribbella flavida DSM 17836]|uniref:ANTAR domain-containing protein n=1 Tax=Kribbella flavida (strain DSM 17836 / JCM 10339 / NBRC 14399) TaxID=479435 RepID=D2PSH0_KRIFD|nr:GAF and ANTAR domain-containing protein [Kribbella flavida]ADB33108.1 ANTAR domain protein with unknown sensor [Kribbella flavida DSM 17836]
MSRELRLAEVFVELADTLVDDFDVLDLLHTLCERSVELLRADAAGLILADQHDVLQVMASTTEEARVLELFAVQNEEGPCLDCYSTGEQMANINLDEVQQRWPRFHIATAEFGYRSTHALPLRLRGQVIGVLNLFCAEHAVLSDADVKLGQALCDIATVGLLHERVVRQGEVLAEQLQGALNSRVLLEQAKGIQSERAGIGVDEAFTLMRAYARRTNQPLRTVAEAVIDGSIAADELKRPR